MKPGGKNADERSALDLIEESAELLRQLPGRVWLIYFVGTVPWALGLLFFWVDMTTGGWGEHHAEPGAIALALLFLWMKVWHSVFSSRLQDLFAGRPASAWSLSRVLRTSLIQGMIQPPRLFILPVAFVVALPFPWLLAFFENMTAVGNGESAPVRPVLRRAIDLSAMWPLQNHLALGLGLLVAIIVWLNSAIAIIGLPYLVRMLFGIESTFTRGGVSMFVNTTFLATSCLLAYLIIDPLIKAFYGLRCFYGEARTDGRDLMAELNLVRLGKSVASVVLILVGLSLPLSTLPLQAQSASNSVPQSVRISSGSAANPASLDEALSKTLESRKYRWRMPKPVSSDESGSRNSWLRGFFQALGEVIGNIIDSIGKAISWLRRLLGGQPTGATDETNSGPPPLREILSVFAYILLGISAVILFVLVWRMRHRFRSHSEVVRAEVLPLKPDLNSEDVMASQLPVDGWLQMYQELMEKGDLRLAMRALYLASLAQLAQREVLTLARFKTNRDYLRELNWRARAFPQLQTAFGENVAAFDRVWYGLYEVTEEGVQHFRSNVERMRS
jgi:hypothetical protein